MATTTTAPRISERSQELSIVAGRRRAHLREALLGLLFVAPVAVIAFIFQLFPVVYGFYISMQGGVNIPKDFVGLDHFVGAIGSLAYMIALLISVVFAMGGYSLYRRAKAAMAQGGGNFYPFLIPGFIAGPATLVFFGIFFKVGLDWAAWSEQYQRALEPFRIGLLYSSPALVILFVAAGIYYYLNVRLARETDQPQGLLYIICSWGAALMIFSAVLLALYTFSELHRVVAGYQDILMLMVKGRYIVPVLPQMIAFGGAAAGIAGIFAINRMREQIDADVQPGLMLRLGLTRTFFVVTIVIFVVYVLAAQHNLNLAVNDFARVTRDQLREAGIRESVSDITDGLARWEEVYTMLVGIGMLGLAYYYWNSARRAETTLSMLRTLMIAIFLIVGGYLFIGELPSAAARGDKMFFDSMVRTLTYASLTVPIQLGLGLGLAYLLFHEVRWGKGLFRLIFFTPYIAPVVATAAVFAMIFSASDVSPTNQIMKSLGLPVQQWLRSQKGIFQIAAEIIGGPRTQLPPWLAGPGLPLFSAIIYAIWVFSGYNAVIFMAGLGNVPKEVYEAAQVDGAGRWTTFRKIVFPLISPTTFFLTVLAVIGTFRAFTHIWVLRTDERGAIDTAMIYIYDLIKTPQPIKSRPYAAALSFLLFGIILVLTMVQNRLSKDRVFYG